MHADSAKPGEQPAMPEAQEEAEAEAETEAEAEAAAGDETLEEKPFLSERAANN